MKNSALELEKMIERYVSSFEKVLYEEDTHFLEGMKENNLAHDDISKYQFWEWTQGVGLFGIWKVYKKTGKQEYLNILTKYYDRQMSIGFPAKNVNTVTPLLAMSFVAENQNREDYFAVCREWAQWILTDFPRTKEGGFQHKTSDSLNEEELWDDTLFMTVLFLANMGRILGRDDYLEEARYQFLLHIKYLSDRETGLWYHGWTFKEAGHFAGAFWGRGNCWVTAAIPELIELIDLPGETRRFLEGAWSRQVESLVRYQADDGMWHTLIDDPTSYVEASATCGFGYGILKGLNIGIGEQKWADAALSAVDSILGYTDQEGILHQVSYGTPMGRESKQFYKEIELKPMPYGQALAILYFMEVIEFLNKKEEEIL